MISSGVGEIRGERSTALSVGEARENMKAWRLHRFSSMIFEHSNGGDGERTNDEML